MRVELLIPWHERDDGRWALAHLPPHRFDARVVSCAPPAGTRAERLPPYLREWLTLLRRRAPRPDGTRAADVLVTWEMRAAVAARLSFARSGRPAHWIALGPILKGPWKRLPALARWVLKDADRIACFTTAERDAYPSLLSLPAERFTYLPTTWPAEAVSDTDDGYILALGHSGRDYPTLIEAARHIDLPVVLVAASPSALRGSERHIPPNVTVRYRTDPAETDSLVRRARLHALPLHPSDVSAGQSVLLRAMACGKPVIASDTAGVRDYVRPGETALTVPPADPVALRAALCRLWHDADERARIGAAAHRAVRDTFGHEAFAARLAALLDELPAADPGSRETESGGNQAIACD